MGIKKKRKRKGREKDEINEKDENKKLNLLPDSLRLEILAIGQMLVTMNGNVKKEKK